jgi:hypothetical protein
LQKRSLRGSVDFINHTNLGHLEQYDCFCRIERRCGATVIFALNLP